MYENLSKGNMNFEVNNRKEDVYALGLVLLEAGNGKSVQNIYDSPKKKVDQVKLNDHLMEFKRRHGDNTLLTDSVEQMV